MKLLAAAILALAILAAPAAEARPHAKHHSKKAATFRHKAKNAKAPADKLSAVHGPAVGQWVYIPTPSLPNGTPLVLVCRVLYASPSLQIYRNCYTP